MPAKKKSASATRVAARNGNRASQGGSAGNSALKVSDDAKTNRSNLARPFYIEGESPEEREKRLAKRKALTLKIFQMAYDAHNSRKAS